MKINKVNQQLIDVVSIVHETSTCYPIGEHFFLSPTKVKDYPDTEGILRKMQNEWDIIEILQFPNARNLPHDEFMSYESECGSEALDKLLSYVLKAKPNFDEFYEEFIESVEKSANSSSEVKLGAKAITWGPKKRYTPNKGRTKDLLEVLARKKKYVEGKLLIEVTLNTLKLNYPATGIKETQIATTLRDIQKGIRKVGIPLEIEIKNNNVTLRQK